MPSDQFPMRTRVPGEHASVLAEWEVTVAALGAVVPEYAAATAAAVSA